MSRTRLEKVVKGGVMAVTVNDPRVHPEYKDVQVVAFVRNMINEAGLDWDVCLEVGEVLQLAIENADYLSDDTGRTWALSYIPGGKND